jgi:multiple sugar transport system substrate-binding protein
MIGAPLTDAWAADLAVPTADVQDPGFKAEPSATIRVLRPAKFVDADEVLFRANTKAFTDKTGIPVRADFVNWEDMGPQTAVTANTGAGPDIIVGFGSDPQIYADKLLPVNDLATSAPNTAAGTNWHCCIPAAGVPRSGWRSPWAAVAAPRSTGCPG